MPMCTHYFKFTFTDCHTDFKSPKATQCSGVRLVLKSSICFLAGINFQKCTSCSFYPSSSHCPIRDSREGLQTSLPCHGSVQEWAASPEDTHSSQVPPQHMPLPPPNREEHQARAPAQHLPWDVCPKLRHSLGKSCRTRCKNVVLPIETHS